jgi:hypothetical protein
MPGDDALSAAIQELYSLDPEDFTGRRGALAAAARQDGDAAAARAITALRRPTKAAWLINRLVRTRPDVARELAGLAARLRDAQRSLDGTQLRELTQQRRKVIDSAGRQAFEVSGQAEAAAALRHEVASTLEAALADPDVAEQLNAGTLLRSAQWSGFGDAGPTLSAVPTPRPDRGPARTSKPAKRAGAVKTDRNTSAAARPDPPAHDSAARRRRDRLARAEDGLAAADGELKSAAAAQRECDERVAMTLEQLADARRRQDEARLRARQAKARLREAQRKLARAQG